MKDSFDACFVADISALIRSTIVMPDWATLPGFRRGQEAHDVDCCLLIHPAVLIYCWFNVYLIPLLSWFEQLKKRRCEVKSTCTCIRSTRTIARFSGGDTIGASIDLGSGTCIEPSRCRIKNQSQAPHWGMYMYLVLAQVAKDQGQIWEVERGHPEGGPYIQVWKVSVMTADCRRVGRQLDCARYIYKYNYQVPWLVAVGQIVDY